MSIGKWQHKSIGKVYFQHILRGYTRGAANMKRSFNVDLQGTSMNKPQQATSPCLANRIGSISRFAGIGILCCIQFFNYCFAQEQTQKPYIEFTARASLLDPRVKAYPQIDFHLEKEGKPTDVQHACRRPDTNPKGKLVVWLMGPSPELFHFLADEGFHVLRVHYANGWFNRFGKEPPPEDRYALGKIRLEAATGQDYSDLVAIETPDGMQERVVKLLGWLNGQDPEGKWGEFLKASPENPSQVDWEKVIISGASHGATTSARFALHQKVGRVVMFCGPRDQYESWQSLDSATPKERFFGFSHALDTGWTADHYCRSWELLGLHAYGPIVNVDRESAPFGNTRRLITDADVGGDEKRAHSCVTPGKAALRGPDGQYLHKQVWRYLFCHPVESVGQATAMDSNCKHQLRNNTP